MGEQPPAAVQVAPRLACAHKSRVRIRCCLRPSQWLFTSATFGDAPLFRSQEAALGHRDLASRPAVRTHQQNSVWEILDQPVGVAIGIISSRMRRTPFSRRTERGTPRKSACRDESVAGYRSTEPRRAPDACGRSDSRHRRYRKYWINLLQELGGGVSVPICTSKVFWHSNR